ncbi:MAG: flavodoxin domain-containing protein [Candidatus Brachytrichaceae bacterium NZ_4S206]|jgi:flavodoxin
MDKIGLFYGSFFGNTERAAGEIKRALERIADVTVDVVNIGKVKAEAMLAYDRLIFGISMQDI